MSNYWYINEIIIFFRFLFDKETGQPMYRQRWR